MPKFDSGRATNLGGLNIQSRRGDDLLGIRFEARSAAPTSSNDLILYRRGSSLYLWDGSSETQLTSPVAGGVPAWETLFAADATFTITPDTTFTIAGNRATATDVVTLTNIGGGSGNVLQITNSGTGKDINGTSNTWNVTKAGVATFAGVSISGTTTAMVYTGAAVMTLKDNDSAAMSIGASGATSMLVFDTSNGAEVVKTSATIFQVTSGKTNLINASNTVNAFVVTDNTITTFGTGPAADAGMAVLRSTSLTTGTLLKLQLTEGTLNGGLYLEAFDVTAGGVVFSVGEDGAHVITGAGGSDMLTVTAGDVVISDGSITMTDADNAATLSVTNNTATSASVFVFAGSGVFTGSTTTSFLTITPSGLTTGTAVYLPVAGLTTGKALHVVGNALTSGNLMAVTSSATAITGNGRLFLSSHSGATGTSATLNEFSSAANDETVILKVTASDVLALGTALSIATGSMTTGTAISVTGTSITTGTGLTVTGLDALTSGIGIQVTSAATAITGAGRMFFSNHTGATGTSAILNEFKSAANDETEIVKITGTAALALGIALDVSVASMTTGTGILVTGTAITTGKGVSISGLDALTSGIALNITSAATAITGAGRLIFSNHTGATGTSAILNEFKSAATDETIVFQVTAAGTGDALKIVNTGALASGGGALDVTSSGATAAGAGVLRVAQSGTPAGATSYLALFDNTGMTATNNPVAVLITQIGTAAGLKVTTSGAVAAGAGVLTLAQTGTPTATGYTLLVDNSGMTSTNNPPAMFINHVGTGGAIKVTTGVTSTHFYKILVSTTGGTIWMGDGTTANAALSGTAGDILINGGSGKPEYCTGTTNWTALV